MKIIYKEEPEGYHAITLIYLKREFPNRKFRIIKDFWGNAYGIKEKVGFYWKELDLKAMGLYHFNYMFRGCGGPPLCYDPNCKKPDGH